MPRRQRDVPFDNCVSPEIAANYCLLCQDKRVAEVLKTLKGRGMTARHAEILLRIIASIPRDWRSGNEPWKQALKRRERLAKRLHNIADEIATDSDLGGWCFKISAEHMNTPLEHREGLRSLADLLHEAAVLLKPSNRPLIETQDREILSSAEYELRTRPARKVSLSSYVVRAIFELLKDFISAASNERPEPRALNKETAILASVLLRERITPQTVSQLRKKIRRRYAPREKTHF